jgi:hypothetical protein
MASVVQSAGASVASAFEPWYRRFLRNRDSPCALPWHDPDLLSATERHLVARSMQQFQLGEWAHGRGLMRRASSHTIRTADYWFLPALELFIAEEQRHSRILGEFLDREGIPRLTRHWLDGAFRGLRKLAGLEVCITVLVTAEAVAIPFYQALRDATRSRLLRSICVLLLRDEAGHLNYQALTLGLIRSRMSASARVVRLLLHIALFRSTAFVIWHQHRKVFLAAGWDSMRFWNATRRGFELLQIQICRAHPVKNKSAFPAR